MNLQKKRVFVTGGAGFIGSTLVRELLKEKADVIVYDNFISGDVRNLKEVANDIEIIQGDIRDPNLSKLLEKKEIDFLFNLAALPYIQDCYNKPLEFFDVDAKGAMNVILAAKKADVKKIIQYSTSEVYGTAKYVPIDENHPTLPLSTYAVSKLAADRICYTLSFEQEIPVVILRQFNTYGPRETQPYVIPEIMTQLSTSHKIKLGNIKARRDFVHVSDAARAAIMLMKAKQGIGDVFNCGSGNDYSIELLAKTIGDIFDKKIEIVIDENRLRPLDVELLRANYFKLYKLTEWTPKINLEEGLNDLVEWFHDNNKKWLWEEKIAPADKVWIKKKVSDVKKIV